MKDNKSKKELKMQYKDRKVVGGVFVIRNTSKNKLLLGAATDLQGSRNRFEFAKQTGSCIDMKLKDDWTDQNGRDFEFEVLEELEKGETQTDAEFDADINLLKEIWTEKLTNHNLY